MNSYDLIDCPQSKHVKHKTILMILFLNNDCKLGRWFYNDHDSLTKNYNTRQKHDFTLHHRFIYRN